MKKTITTIITAVVLTLTGFAQVPHFSWARATTGSTNQEMGLATTTDVNGNVYVTGKFLHSTMTFGSTILTNADNTGNSYDIFLVKYNALGNLLWAKSGDGSKNDIVTGVAADASGNVIITGYFDSPTLTFGSITLTNTFSNTKDIFIVKYDVSGNVLWAKVVGGTMDAYSNQIATDLRGNILITGNFFNTTMIFGSDTLTNTNTSFNKAFVVKYNTNGNVVWAKAAGGLGNEGLGIATDTSCNVMLTGIFSDSTITFGSVTVRTTYSGGNFIAKLDSLGNANWIETYFITDRVQSIAVDLNGNSYLTGNFHTTQATIGSYTITNDTTNGSRDIYLVKYDRNGTIVWVKSAGGSSNDYPYSIATDGNGNILMIGTFSGNKTIFGSTVLTCPDTYNIFIVKYNPMGNIVWGKAIDGAYTNQGYGIATDINNNIYITGYFNCPTITFGSITLTNPYAYYSKMYLAKIDSTQMTVGINEITSEENGINIYPNPFTSQTTISFSEAQKNTTIKIMDVVGKEIKTVLFSGKSLILEKGEMQSGVYFVQITDEKKNVVNKKVVVE